MIKLYRKALNIYCLRVSFLFVAIISDETGNIVVANELEIINGSLAIGSAIPKYPISEIVINNGIIVVVTLYTPISEIAVKITGIEKEIILYAILISSLKLKFNFNTPSYISKKNLCKIRITEINEQIKPITVPNNAPTTEKPYIHIFFYILRLKKCLIIKQF